MAALDADGLVLWNTFLGGTDNDNGRGVAVVGGGAVAVVGKSSRSWGSPGRAFSGTFDAYVAVVTSPPLAGNDAPTDITITATSVLENRNVNYTMGTFSTADPEGGAFTYTLVAGTGDGDNASFNILNSSLRVNGPFDYETKKLYSIRVRSTDSGGQWLEKAFTIEVLDVNEPPVAVNDAATTAEDTPIDIPVLDNDTDPEGTQLQIISPPQACVFVVGVNCPLHYVPAPNFCGTDTVSYTVTDGEYTATRAGDGDGDLRDRPADRPVDDAW